MTTPKQGDVWLYDYLWQREHDAGEEHGRKPRPTALVATVTNQDGTTNLFILPITSKMPGIDRLALEVPEIECKRAGLDADKRLWIILDEYNHDILETSFYLDPNGRLGAFSAMFNKKALRIFTEAARKRQARRVPRTD
ncbi:MAG: hypothetical protein CVT70_17200 [Alphaproteobacteria bacterium HGW-Alphaproteobacteria-1]|jgi:hypothetical protein|nr:MAG: hypothetical protein CVT70_17200 [Alphaproteobacteria bacterium HGW-Alphaproteobacteria-1]